MTENHIILWFDESDPPAWVVSDVDGETQERSTAAISYLNDSDHDPFGKAQAIALRHGRHNALPVVQIERDGARRLIYSPVEQPTISLWLDQNLSRPAWIVSRECDESTTTLRLEYVDMHEDAYERARTFAFEIARRHRMILMETKKGRKVRIYEPEPEPRKETTNGKD